MPPQPTARSYRLQKGALVSEERCLPPMPQCPTNNQQNSAYRQPEPSGKLQGALQHHWQWCILPALYLLCFLHSLRWQLAQPLQEFIGGHHGCPPNG